MNEMDKIVLMVKRNALLELQNELQTKINTIEKELETNE